MASHTLALIFALLRRLPETMANQRAHRWVEIEADEITGKIAGVVGFGALGQAIAKCLRALGARVYAADIAPPAEDAACDRFYRSVGGLPQLFLNEIDLLIVTCPLTASTRGMINAAAFDALKPSAHLINVSRGPVINERDLIAALRAKRIAGAGLDVMAEEPLPAESPLWDLPGVIVTPHIAWSSPLLEARLADLIAANYRRYVRGEPLMNLVDKHVGY